MARRVFSRRVVVLVLTAVFLASLALPASVRAADGSVAPRLAWQADGWDIDFSPDGRLVALVYTNVSVVREPTAGEVASNNVTDILQVRWADTGEVVAEAVVTGYGSLMRTVGWSPAGDRIAVSYMGSVQPVSLWSWDGVSLHPEGILVPPEFTGLSTPAWSPNGTAIVLAQYVWDVATQTLTATLDLSGIVEDSWLDVWEVVWSPTGDMIYLRYTYEVASGELPRRGGGIAAVSMGTGQVAWSRDGVLSFDVSPDGTLLVATVPTDPPRVMILNGSTGDVVRRWTEDPATPLAWSSDGRILYATALDEPGALYAYPTFDRVATIPSIDGAMFPTRVRFDPDDRRLAMAWWLEGGIAPTPEEFYKARQVVVVDLAPPPPILLVGGILVVAGGGAAAVGYGWHRRRRRNAAEREDGP
jgi:WD40 repeat protein